MKSSSLLLLLALLLFAGLLLVSPSHTTEPRDSFFDNLRLQHQASVERHKHQSLSRFFKYYHCPDIAYQLINDFLYAADKNNLDYRIIPAVFLQESSCGKHYPEDTNNVLGWESARKTFATIPECIGFVAERFANGRYYQGKSLIQKLLAYNPNPAYGPKILKLMAEIETQ